MQLLLAIRIVTSAAILDSAVVDLLLLLTV